jgi:fimbrial isopeptide formation D2 family protein/LPXTG-motif cell wall-anchored protein
MSLCSFALAEDQTGTITINNAAAGVTYQIYRILDLESYSADREAYLYKTNETWEDFIAAYNTEHKITGVGDNVGDPIELDSNGYVTSAGFTVETFASEALAYATENGIAADDTQVANSSTVEFKDLPLGYYLVNSGAGSLLVLNTTNPSMTITEKNDLPTVEKKIILGTGRSDTTTASIGDVIWFRTNISAKKGAENYVLHDKMDEGLTLDQQSLKIMDEDSNELASTSYNVVTEGLQDGCTFELRFTKAYLDTITGNTTIRVHYSAKLNGDANVVKTGNEVNQNSAWLTYGDQSKTEESTVEIKTFRIQVVKIDEKDNVLSGAEFKLYKDAEGTEQVYVKKLTNGDYQVTDEKTDVLIEAGTPTIEGLGDGTYYLEETKAPAGYNRVTERKEFTINDSSSMGTFTDDTNKVYNAGVGGGISVVNKKGTLLPATGGSGTIFIYIGGALLVVVGCLLLLKWRKREKVERRES